MPENKSPPRKGDGWQNQEELESTSKMILKRLKASRSVQGWVLTLIHATGILETAGKGPDVAGIDELSFRLLSTVHSGKPVRWYTSLTLYVWLVQTPGRLGWTLNMFSEFYFF